MTCGLRPACSVDQMMWYTLSMQTTHSATAVGDGSFPKKAITTSKKISGIYEVVNNANGNRYVGRSADIKQRWRDHKSNYLTGKRSCPGLFNAFNKYGLNNFTWSILLITEDNKNLLTHYEQWFLDNTKCKYNTAVRAANFLPVGELCGTSKLTSDQVYKIVKLYTKGYSTTKLAGMFGVLAGQIRKILAGQAWKHLGIHPVELRPDYGVRSSILNEEQIKSICLEYKKHSRNANAKILAKKYNVSRSLIQIVVTKDTMNLPNNQTCAWCKQPFHRDPQIIKRYKREDKTTCCSISCGKQLGQATKTYNGWLDSLDLELSHAIKESMK